MKVARISWGFLALLTVSPFLGRPTFSLRLASSLDFIFSVVSVSLTSFLVAVFEDTAFGLSCLSV